MDMATTVQHKKRKPNWTQDECLSLVHMVNESKTVLRGKLGPNLTSQKKRETWEHITSRLNARSSYFRSREEVEKKWNNIFSQCKSEISEFRRETTQTGGGPGSKPLSSLAEGVLLVIGEGNTTISGVVGGIDSSILQVVNNDQGFSEALNEQETEAQSVLADFMFSLPASSAPPVPISPAKDDEKEINKLKIKKLQLQTRYYELKIKKLNEV